MCRYCEGCQGISLADALKLQILWKRYGYEAFVKWQYSFFKESISNKDFSSCVNLCPYGIKISEIIEELKEID